MKNDFDGHDNADSDGMRNGLLIARRCGCFMLNC